MQHQLSAVGSRILLADADDKQKVSDMSAEAIGVLIALSNPGNRYMSLIAGIAQEP